MNIENLIGRQKEIAELERAFRNTAKGRGGVLLVAGEAGVGRTRLLEDTLEKSGLHVLTGRARSDAPSPYGPVTAVLRGGLEDLRKQEYFRGPLSGHLANLLPELGPSPGETDSDVLVEAVITALCAIAQDRPTVLFFDDLHGADNATIELIPTLAERIQDAPLLVLGTYRNDEITRDHPIRRLRDSLRRARSLHELTVGTLDRAETGAMLEAVLGAKVSNDLVETVFEKSQGVPLYVEELARALAASGRLEEGGDVIGLASKDDLPIPESVRDSVLLRLDALSPPARSALEAAAVIGVDFDFELVGRIAEDPSAIEELLDRFWIFESAPGVGSFRHELIREAVKSEIGWSRRRSLSRRIASYLEREGSPPERVVGHWLAAQEYEAACNALLDLADRSCRLHAYRDAAAAAHQALEIWPASLGEAKRLEALRQLAHCAQVSGELGAAVRALREVVDSTPSAKDTARHAEALRDLATVYGLQGATEQSLSTRTASAEAFEAAGLPAEAATEWLAVAARLTADSSLERALQVVRKASALAVEAKRSDLEVRTKGFEGNLLAMVGRFDEGRKLAQEALSLALNSNLAGAAAEAYRRLASVLDYGSDFAGSRDAYMTAVNYCRAQGDDGSAQVCLGCMCAIVYRTGHWKRTLETVREVSSDPLASGGSHSIAETIAGLVYAARGETRAARKRFKTATAMAHEGGARVIQLMCRFGMALVAELEGGLDKAAELHQQVIEGWQETEDRHDLIPCFLWQATFFGRLGREHETTQRADALARVASATGNAETMAALAHALGEVSLLNGKSADAVDHFRRGLAQAEKLEIPFELAIITWRLGTALAADGDRSGAVRHLSNAYRVARKLGARPTATLIAGELEALGERIEEGRYPQEAGRSGRAGLTRRQAEIVRLLADGLTNKEIASKLYLSSRTVDMHVSNILDRLDCAGRTEAARKAAELGLLD